MFPVPAIRSGRRPRSRAALAGRPVRAAALFLGCQEYRGTGSDRASWPGEAVVCGNPGNPGFCPGTKRTGGSVTASRCSSCCGQSLETSVRPAVYCRAVTVREDGYGQFGIWNCGRSCRARWNPFRARRSGPCLAAGSCENPGSPARPHRTVLSPSTPCCRPPPGAAGSVRFSRKYPAACSQWQDAAHLPVCRRAGGGHLG